MGRVFPGQSIGVFRVSNGTELDVLECKDRPRRGVQVLELYLGWLSARSSSALGMLYAVSLFIGAAPAPGEGETLGPRVTSRHRVLIGDATLYACCCAS